ncbi:hypothetical protein MaudCBS49596_005284 [Microsporum audouinii]
MKFTTTVTLVTAGFLSIGATQVYASPVSDPLPYPEGPLTYLGPVAPDGETVSLKGTVQEIYAQAEGLAGSTLNPDDHSKNHPDRNIQARYKTSMNCYPQGDPASVKSIQEGIRYLNGLSGKCGGAARTCTRVSCSWKSGIFLCNDTTNTISIPCKQIADYAQDILDTCVSPQVVSVRGQVFDSGNFNVVVKKGSC